MHGMGTRRWGGEACKPLGMYPGTLDCLRCHAAPTWRMGEGRGAVRTRQECGGKGRETGGDDGG